MTLQKMDTHSLAEAMKTPDNIDSAPRWHSFLIGRILSPLPTLRPAGMVAWRRPSGRGNRGNFDPSRGVDQRRAGRWTNLNAAGCMSLQAIHDCPQDELAAVVRPSGYFNAKARKLKAFAAHIVENYGGDLDAFLSLAPTGPAWMSF